MMKNTRENTKTKNTSSLIIAIVGVIVCLVFMVLMMLPDNKNDTPIPMPTPNPSPTAAREYWTVELNFSGSYMTTPYLKKVSENKDGKIVKIESINITKKNVREYFYYKKGKLGVSETYSSEPISINGKEFADKKLYETRYVYVGDILAKAEVYINGVPTRSYDKYVYNMSGELDAIERYEMGKLEITYFYNGNKYPERIEHRNGVHYVLEHDEDGNLTRATSDDHLVEIDYKNGKPNCFYVVSYDRKNRDEKSISGSADTRKHESRTTYSYGNGGEIVKETVESVTTYYSADVQVNSENVSFSEAIYEYDGEGRLTDVIIYLDNKFDHRRSYTYDKYGNIASLYYCDENGEKSSRVFEITRKEGEELTVEIVRNTHTVIYKYDKSGNLLNEIGLESNGARSYENTYEYYPNGTLKKKSMDKNTFSDTWTYFENGNLEKYVYEVYSHAYKGSVEEFIQSDVCYGFSRQEGFSSVSSFPLMKKTNNSTTDYFYREDLTLEKKVSNYVNGGCDVYEYDGEGNLSKITQYDADGNVIHEYDYTSSNG